MMCSYTATVVYCDECGCELTVSEDKASSSEILRRHGWHITEKGEYCPECSKKYQKYKDTPTGVPEMVRYGVLRNAHHDCNIADNSIQEHIDLKKG